MLHEGVYEMLKRVARAEGIATYAGIAAVGGFDIQSMSGHAELAEILTQISTYEHSQGRPLLTAVVHDRATNLPGPEFFELAKRLKVQTDKEDVEFYWEELQRVYEAWRPRTSNYKPDGSE